MARKPRELPDYFTQEEAQALIRATDSAETRMVMRLMLRCGLRVSEALSLRPSDLRLDQEPPLVSLPADVVGNKAKVAREIPIPADIIEFVRDRSSGKVRVRNDKLFTISRQAVGQGMKKAAEGAGIAAERVHPHAFRHTYGRHCVLSGVPVNVLQEWLGHSKLSTTMIYVKLAGAHHSYVERI